MCTPEEKWVGKQKYLVAIGTKFTLMRIIIIYVNVDGNGLLGVEKWLSGVRITGLGRDTGYLRLE